MNNEQRKALINKSINNMDNDICNYQQFHIKECEIFTKSMNKVWSFKNLIKDVLLKFKSNKIVFILNVSEDI